VGCGSPRVVIPGGHQPAYRAPELSVLWPRSLILACPEHLKSSCTNDLLLLCGWSVWSVAPQEAGRVWYLVAYGQRGLNMNSAVWFVRIYGSADLGADPFMAVRGDALRRAGVTGVGASAG
jgi:hypothetical protein